MNPTNQQELLKLARETIKAKFTDRKYDLGSIHSEFKEKRGVFVTLTKKGELRGCIGFIQPIKSVYEAVKENALNAAFHDPRFKPLQKEELKEIKIEISILSQPIKVDFKEPLELIKKLKPKHHGVILEKNGHQATFLPQVWEQIPEPEEFLRHLSWKAGLSIDAWKSANILVYVVEKFEER
ncbi:MAG: AmmeMemoRadiSam system protein A [Nanoarchaeota archaeon]